MKKYNIKAEVSVNRKIAEGYFKLVLNAPAIAKVSNPGQFLHILINQTGRPFLRRPFSIHRVRNKDFVEILYEVVGFGTRILSTVKPGECLNVIGPLGSSFDYSVSGDFKPILIAGGMGVAPLVFLADKIGIKHGLFRKYRQVDNKNNFLVLIGARTKSEVLCIREFQDFGFRVCVATEDGSLGFKGRATDLLKELLLDIEKPTDIFTCGPKAMIKEITKISEEKKIATQASLEEMMACGVGACLGCAIKTKQEYKMVCKDGPVFDAANIDWPKII